jgi:squalene-hopene/tetraprenyl-beta-curcumene cyclase
MMIAAWRGLAVTGVVALAAAVSGGRAQTPASQPSSASAVTTRYTRLVADDARTPEEARRLTAAGAKYLLSAQEADGGWGAQAGVGVASLALKALIQEPTVGPQHSAVRRGVEFVLKSQRDDGGVYSAEGLYKNYESSVALSMLSALKDPAYEKPAAALQKFLKDNQWDEGEGKSPADPFYGGAGYGQSKRPDLSNTQMMVEALHDSGLPPDDPAYKKALVFIQRCQMLGETNDQAFARGSTQGGFIYSPVSIGESKAETEDVEGRTELRCYGSMTYAGFKSMLYAGLKHDDRRVQAALDWMRRNWTLEYNPNMPEKQSRQGLFYYYHVFARALEAWGDPVVQDRAGREHVWRQELVEQLAKTQRPDGSWVNEADRWMEGLPSLTTAYALLALQAAYPGSE